MKVGFVLLSGPGNPIPSTRVAVLNILPLLRAAGVEAEILFSPGTPSETPALPDDLAQRACAAGHDIVVFQKLRGPAVARLVGQLRAVGIRTAYLVCDLVDIEMADITDATVLVTEFLRSQYPAHLAAKLHVVHDGIEHPEVVKHALDLSRGSRRSPLRAVLVTSAALDALPVLGSPPDWLRVTVVGRYAPRLDRRARLDRLRWTLAEKSGLASRLAYLRFLADRRICCEAWDAAGVYEHLTRADIGIIPIDSAPSVAGVGAPAPGWKLKSENRLTLKMSVGLPVVATPIPAYEPVIDQGVNGYLAQSRAQWLEALDVLRDPEARRRIGQAARVSVLHRFSQQEQARRLVEVFTLLTRPE